MGFIKEFKDFAMKGNLVDISVAFVMGGAFGKLVSSLTDGIIAPLIGMIGGADLNKDVWVIQKGVAASKDATGKEVAAIQEVVIKWGEFLSTGINFIIVAFVMFILIKGLNAMKKKHADAQVAAGPSSTDALLMEIRDSLKK
ncbi:MAG: large conductance mechanosensitive channel protein MscL [Chitinophagaceae bacterium]